MLGGNSSSTYNGAITGAGGLMVFGPGNVTLASPLNTYAGNTRVQSGTLTVGNPLALQNTVVDMNVADAGTLSFGNQAAATLGGLIGSRNVNLGSTNVSDRHPGICRRGSAVHRRSERPRRHHEGRQRQHQPGWRQHLHRRYLRLRRYAHPGWPVDQRKIMALGDSITEGADSTIGYGYRGFLYNDLVAGGYTNVLNVGSHNTNPGTLPANQQWHSGYGGWTIEQIESNVGSWLTTLASGYGNGNTTGTAGNPPPDYITLMIGTNDDGSNLTTEMTNYTQMLKNIWAVDPNVKIFAADLTPRGGSIGADPWVTSFNTDLHSLILTEQAAGMNITEVNMYSNFPYATGMGSDNLHPNDTGYAWMAQQWYNALVSGGAGAGNVLPATSTVTMSAGGYLNAVSSETIGPLAGTGGTVNIGGGTLTINGIANTTYSGAVTGAGGLFKSGGAALTLAGTSTYTGATTVNAGQLVVVPAASLASSSLTVQNNGTLTGNNAALPPIIALAGGHIAPGVVAGTFTAGSLSHPRPRSPPAASWISRPMAIATTS